LDRSFTEFHYFWAGAGVVPEDFQVGFLGCEGGGRGFDGEEVIKI
jgi:hypothetical protein